MSRNQDKRRAGRFGSDEQTIEGGRKVRDNEGPVMYDPVTQLLWDAGKQWFGCTRGQIIANHLGEFKELIKGFKGYTKVIDDRIDNLLKQLGD